MLDHSIDTYGYGLKLYHSGLNPQIATIVPDKALQSKVIPAIKKGTLTSGDSGLTEEQVSLLLGLRNSISVETLYPQMVYLADTSVSIMDNEEIYQYPVIVVECTFYDKADLEEAALKKHVHYHQLLKYIREHKSNKFILIHSSCKYTDEMIMSLVSSEEDVPENIYIWLDAGPIAPNVKVVPPLPTITSSLAETP